MTRAGIVTVVGKPNAGKSTLLNRVVGQKLSITSPKPQSTRDRVVGIRTEDGVQMVILDTPGLLNPRYALQEAMRGAALQALDDADVVVYLADAEEGLPPSLEEAAALSAAILISALSGEGLDSLLARVAERLPESPYLYPEDEISTQHLRFFASELIRETALEQLEDEVPYSVACEIEEFRESRSPVYIRAVVYVERESQKRILIGHKGARVREIGRVARTKLEELVGASVYLDLWVKVLANWRKNVSSMQRFGYRVHEGRSP